MKNKFENPEQDVSKLSKAESENPEEFKKSIERGFIDNEVALQRSLEQLGNLIKNEKVSGAYQVKRAEAVRKMKDLAEFIRTEVV